MAHSLRPSVLINLLVWVSITIYGVYFLYTLFDKSIKKKPINFGIDLVGGTYLTLDVKVKEAIKNELLSQLNIVKDRVQKDNNIVATGQELNLDNNLATLSYVNSQDAASAFEVAKKASSSWVNVNQQENKIVFSMNAAQLNSFNFQTVENDRAILRTRLDPYGAGEIPIIAQGNKLIIELPNVSDPEQAKARIGTSAILEMKSVFDEAPSKDALLEKYNGKLPEATIVINDAKDLNRVYLVPQFAKLTGKMLKDASHGVNRETFTKGTPDYVLLEFNAEGTEAFHQLTKENLGGKVAIILDNVGISVPHVSIVIPEGKATISGNFSPEEAKELVTLLKSGSFSAPVEVIEERTIGPSLGAESIKKGLLSCAIGLALLFLFSIFVYKIAGLFAFLVLLYNLLLILFGLALIPDATLTLPGIAGMVLTVGMAIDSSILIYERIKEELSMGSSLRKAVDAGFNGALGVILDANITTFIVGAVLYYMGSPAIQGFALTMMIGIVATLITGLVLLKFIFNLLLDSGVQKIQI